MNALLPPDEVQAEITLGGFDHAEAESRETRLTAACHIASPPMSPVETAANT